MSQVVCPICESSSDPEATSGYCDNCGKKLPGLFIPSHKSTPEPDSTNQVSAPKVTASSGTPANSIPAYLIGLTALIQVKAISVLILAIDSATDPIDQLGVGAHVACVLLMFTLVEEAICIGLWVKAPIAWMTGVGYYGFALFSFIIGVFLTPQKAVLIAIPFNLAILARLFTPSVRGGFDPKIARRKPQPRRAPTSNPPRQLVGQNCTFCGSRITNELDSEYCHRCGEPSHLSCRKPAGIHDPGCPGLWPSSEGETAVCSVREMT